MVTVRDRQLLEGLPAVVRAPCAHVQDPDRLGIGGVRVDVVVIPGALPEIAVFARAIPGLTEVVRAKDGAVFGLDDRVHPA